MGDRDTHRTMGISRDSFHKRRKTGGKLTAWRKKRKFELGRQPAGTKIGHKRVRSVRVRGGNLKYRALRPDTGNFSWGTESTTRKCRLLNVSYNSTNNEIVRTNSLVKGNIVQVDAAPFKQWYEQFYGIKVERPRLAPRMRHRQSSRTTFCARSRSVSPPVSSTRHSRPSSTPAVSSPVFLLVLARVAGPMATSWRGPSLSSTFRR